MSHFQISRPAPEDFEGEEVFEKPAMAAQKPRLGKILLEAHALINGQRREQYGDPLEGFSRIAALWNDYLGLREPLTPEDVAIMMILLKIARQRHERKADNLVDIAGYAGLAADLIEMKKAAA